MKVSSMSSVLSIPSDITGEKAFPPHFLAPSAPVPYLPFSQWSALTAMDSLITTAASVHHIHLVRAQKALECVPPRFDLFYFHSAMCNATVKALDILQAMDWSRKDHAPYIPLDDILSSLTKEQDETTQS